MTDLLEGTVYLSVTALVILLFKRIFKNKLSAKWHVLIWALLAIRLVLPSLPESSLSIFNAFDIPQDKEFIGEMQGEVLSSDISENAHDTAVSLYQNSNRDSIEPADENKAPLSPEAIALVICAMGAGVFFLYFVAVYLICVVQMKREAGSVDENTLLLVEECKELMGIKCRVEVVGGGESPMLVGAFRPRIVLPRGYTDGEKRDIIIHELCHLKGGDIYILWLAMAVLCLNWYNPIMWHCFFVFRRDIEVYCDERVLKYVDSKKNYAALLVKTALRRNSFIAGTTSLQNGKKEVERRVRYMAYFKRPHFIWTLLIAVAAVVVTVLCLTNPTEDKEKDNVVVQENEIKNGENETDGYGNDVLTDENNCDTESMDTHNQLADITDGDENESYPSNDENADAALIAKEDITINPTNEPIIAETEQNPEPAQENTASAEITEPVVTAFEELKTENTEIAVSSEAEMSFLPEIPEDPEVTSEIEMSFISEPEVTSEPEVIPETEVISEPEVTEEITDAVLSDQPTENSVMLSSEGLF